MLEPKGYMLSDVVAMTPAQVIPVLQGDSVKTFGTQAEYEAFVRSQHG